MKMRLYDKLLIAFVFCAVVSNSFVYFAQAAQTKVETKKEPNPFEAFIERAFEPKEAPAEKTILVAACKKKEVQLIDVITKKVMAMKKAITSLEEKLRSMRDDITK